MSEMIHQIWITTNNENPPISLQSKIDKVKSTYSNWKYTLWNDVSIREFLKENFDDKVTMTYDLLKPYSFKADLAKLAILYKLGGYYFDVAICPEYSFEPNAPTVFQGNKSLLKSNNLNIVEMSLLCFKESGNKFLKDGLDLLVSNALRLLYNQHPLDVTGPVMLGRIDNTNIDKLSVGYNNDCQCGIDKDGNVTHYYKNKGNLRKDLSELGSIGTNDYEKMWFHNDIYDIEYIGKYFDKLNINKVIINIENRNKNLLPPLLKKLTNRPYYIDRKAKRLII